MDLNVQRAIIRLITPHVWRLFPNRKLNVLRRFSVVEKDSACRFLQYVPLIKDPQIQAEVFRHALEEFHHSHLFNKLALEIDQSHVPTTVLRRQFLITEKSSRDELIDAYAYAYVGESAINQNFAAYAGKGMEPKLRKVFGRIAEDEARHAESTDTILLHLCENNTQKYRKVFNQARNRRWYEEYKLVMNKVGEFQLNMVLRLIYLCFGPLTFLSSRNRLKLGSREALDVFREQLTDIEKPTP